MKIFQPDMAAIDQMLDWLNTSEDFWAIFVQSDLAIT